MCFTKIRTGKYNDVQVAKHDIKCYKELQYDSNTGHIISPYMCIPYFDSTIDISTVREAKFQSFHAQYNSISFGLHVYSNKKYVNSFCYVGNIYNAIIPKGTRYYYNPKKHEYVAEKLIVYNNLRNKENKNV